MRRLRRKTNYMRIVPIMFIIIISVALMPMITQIAKNSVPMLKKFTNKAAVASAFTNMPNQAVKLLEERYKDQILDTSKNKEQVKTVEQKKPKVKKKPVGKTKTDEEKIKIKKKPPVIEKKFRGDILEEFFGVPNAAFYVGYKNGHIKNTTKNDNSVVEKILEDDWKVKLEDIDEPQILIYHTHATESYEPYDNIYYDKRNIWRSTDNTKNVTTVGDAMVEVLEKNGFKVIHDKTQHDYPSYNGSYERSEVTIKKYLKEYPSIKIALDIHRDAIQRGETVVKPVTEFDGKKVAQVMIIAGCDDGTMGVPNWRENLRFGARIQDKMEQKFEGVARPLFFGYRKYNQHLTNGSLLIEVGGHGNTLEEAVYTGEYVAQAISDVLKENRIDKK